MNSPNKKNVIVFVASISFVLICSGVLLANNSEARNSYWRTVFYYAIACLFLWVIGFWIKKLKIEFIVKVVTLIFILIFGVILVLYLK